MKTYVLDTNVLLQSPDAMFAFDDNNVVIPSAVIEELDNFKKGKGELNANAREVARKLHTLKEKLPAGVTLFDYVELPNSGHLRIQDAGTLPMPKDFKFPTTWDEQKRDNDILQTCIGLSNQAETEVILITKDILLGIKADAVGVRNETFRTEEVKSIDEQYSGVVTLYASQDAMSHYAETGSIAVDQLSGDYDEVAEKFTDVYPDTLFPNQFVVITNQQRAKSTMLGRVSRDKKTVNKLNYAGEHPFGVTARNASQLFMQEALMDPVAQTPLVIIKGPAGTAKTFFSLAVALERIYNGNVVPGEQFRKILVCRPNQLLDDDLGYLPGTELEKIMPLMRPIYDNLEVLVDSNRESRASNESELQSKVQDIFARGIIEMQAVGYLRGRSIESQWIVLDEAQNLSPRAAKAVVTRVAQGTKLILCGDPQQIDNQYLDSRTNGISYIAEAMKFSPYVSVITTDDSDVVRSDLAKEAVKYLSE